MQSTHSAEQVVIAASGKTTIIAGGTAAVSGTAEKTGLVEFMGSYGAEIASACAIGGLLLAAAGFAMSVWFQYRRDVREEKLAQARISNRSKGAQ